MSILPQSITVLCLILFLMSAWNYFSFRAFATMTCWQSTEVFLNLVALLGSAVPCLDFKQVNVFWIYGLLSGSILFNLLCQPKVPWIVFLAFDLDVLSSGLEGINVWLMALNLLALHISVHYMFHFSLNPVAHSI